MLKLYICPSCRDTRYVSLENTTCYRCNCPMALSNLPYADYIEMDAGQRAQHIQEFMVQYTNVKQFDNNSEDKPQATPLQDEKLSTRIFLNSKKGELPLYEQEPVSRKHCEDIILLSNMRLFRGVS